MPQNWNLTYMYAQDFPHSCHLRNQLSNQYWKSTTWVIYHGIAQYTKNGKYFLFECTYLSTYFVQVSGEIQWLQKLCLVSQSIQLISVDFPFFSGFLHTVLYSVHSHRYTYVPTYQGLFIVHKRVGPFGKSKSLSSFWLYRKILSSVDLNLAIL